MKSLQSRQGLGRVLGESWEAREEGLVCSVKQAKLAEAHTVVFCWCWLPYKDTN